MAVGGGTDGEVEPVGAAGTALDEEFVKVGLEGALGNLSAFKLTPSCVGEVEEVSIVLSFIIYQKIYRITIKIIGFSVYFQSTGI